MSTIQLITGSTLGGAEYVADHLSDLLHGIDKDTAIHNHPNLAEIPVEGTWIIVTSTHGAGDYPDNIQPFIAQLQETPPNTKSLNYVVIAIGDSSYDTFCGAGLNCYELLEDIGATALAECLTIDVLRHPVPEEAAEDWFEDHKHLF
ncbi:FMN-binding protein MioC [Vibrio sp. UCD-FRSSP16_10]|uniref:FMN-binding protein MioC n=1 Tax=unclassified Vibrio TaxID=2614977 RepID=UPI0007FD45A1|nr:MULTISPECIES: FMN-binding protein MioC [unclassified Vibrio]OBT15616.1 FMN-binding protein MioC [Vibrio sp. UCD-FRSSP16_30]OBT21026.1 FMN-binding protein MioC [Vibrio sp. UCD-FRSSP16_10]